MKSIIKRIKSFIKDADGHLVVEVLLPKPGCEKDMAGVRMIDRVNREDILIPATIDKDMVNVYGEIAQIELLNDILAEEDIDRHLIEQRLSILIDGEDSEYEEDF